jgi:hypothetical protein
VKGKQKSRVEGNQIEVGMVLGSLREDSQMGDSQREDSRMEDNQREDSRMGDNQREDTRQVEGKGKRCDLLEERVMR